MDFREDKITLQIYGETGNLSQRYPNVSRYQIEDYVTDVAFSSVSPEVLYISTLERHMYSFNLNLLTLEYTSVVGDSDYYGSEHAKLIRRLLCHKSFLYTFRSDYGTLRIDKFSIETESKLKHVDCASYSKTDTYRWRPAANSSDGVLYCALYHSILVVDGSTLQELTRIQPLVFGPLHGVYIVDVAVSSDGQLLIATGDTDVPFTVYTCDRDGRTNQLYCDEHVVPFIHNGCETQSERRFIACTSHGHVVAAMESKLAVLSPDDQHKLMHSVSSTGVYRITAMKCSPSGDTIAMVYYSPGKKCNGLIVLPSSAYLPPFQPPSCGQEKTSVDPTGAAGLKQY